MTFIQTFTGKKFDFTNITAESIHTVDIITALSRIPRFNGHTRRHYTVAEHSILVSMMVEASGGSQDEIMAGLMHDAHEAYIGDIVSPLKAFAGTGIEAIEESINAAVAEKFGFPAEAIHSDIVKLADISALWHEKHALLDDTVEWLWDQMLAGREPLPIPDDFGPRIVCMEEVTVQFEFAHTLDHIRTSLV